MSAATMPPKPTPLQVQPENIPEELKALEQWVVWGYRSNEDGDRWTKVPYRARGGNARASSTNPKAWTSFSQAVEIYRLRGFDGVGLVPVGSDPYTAIDLDHCRDPATGNLKMWAAEIVAKVDSYTEASPSGTGIRIFVKGRLRLDKKGSPTGRTRSKVGDFEIYDGLTQKLKPGGRYVTVTGHKLQGDTVNERQAELEQLYDRMFKPETETEAKTKHRAAPDLSDSELLEKIRASKQGPNFIRLFDHGDTSKYARDDNDGKSEADLALCNTLASWTNKDAAEIDRLFRQSALYREKWERPDYAQRTIEAALQRTPEGYKGKHKAKRGTSKAKAATDEQEDEHEGESVAEALVRLALENGLELWHDPERKAWATLRLDGHLEHHPLKTRAVRLYLGRLYYEASAKVAHSQGMQDALGVLEGKAIFDKDTGEHETFVRLAEVDSHVYLDLANETWQAVEITPSGWRVLDSQAVPVRFRRKSGIRPLPTPVQGGKLSDLADLLNLESSGGDLKLVIAWLLAALRGKGPYPVLGPVCKATKR